MMTKTRQKHNEVKAEYARLDNELAVVARAEFPVGSAVRWKHGPRYLAGIVVEHGAWAWSTEFKVKSGKSGCIHHKRAEDLEPVPAAEPTKEPSHN